MRLVLEDRDRLRKDGMLYFTPRDIVCVVFVLLLLKRPTRSFGQGCVQMFLESPLRCSEHKPTQHLLPWEIDLFVSIYGTVNLKSVHLLYVNYTSI